MLKIWPNDAAVQNDEGYTRLLLLSSNAAEDRGQRSEVSGSQGANSTAGGREDSANRPREAGDSVLGKTEQQQRSELNDLVELAAKLVVKNPRSLPHRTFLALAYLKANRPADALVVYKDVTVARNALTPSALAVHAAVLAANGRAEEAQGEARQVKIDNLLPEEKTLLDGLPYD